MLSDWTKTWCPFKADVYGFPSVSEGPGHLGKKWRSACDVFWASENLSANPSTAGPNRPFGETGESRKAIFSASLISVRFNQRLAKTGHGLADRLRHCFHSAQSQVCCCAQLLESLLVYLAILIHTAEKLGLKHLENRHCMEPTTWCPDPLPPLTGRRWVRCPASASESEKGEGLQALRRNLPIRDRRGAHRWDERTQGGQGTRALSRHDTRWEGPAAPLFISLRRERKRESWARGTAFVEKGDLRAEMGKTHTLAMGAWAFSERSLCVGTAETGDALTVPVRLMQGILVSCDLL